jgi:hypothetical protein
MKGDRRCHERGYLAVVDSNFGVPLAVYLCQECVEYLHEKIAAAAPRSAGRGSLGEDPSVDHPQR